MIGDGQNISISKDRWLRGKDNFCVDQDRCNPAVLDSKVCEFFGRDGKVWDVDKVRLNFYTEDANAILNTHIPQVCIKDRIAWVHSIDG